ncbi:MAG: hypothetical protein ACOYL6_19215 [Bacteriovoracaceae bacterium]
MNIKYMEEIDTLYIYLDSEAPKVLTASTFSEDVSVYVSKLDKKKICGYEIENASKTLLLNLPKLKLDLKQLLAVIMFNSRLGLKMSQESMANELEMSLSTLKNLEKANQNISIESFESILDKVPEARIAIAKKLLAS